MGGQRLAFVVRLSSHRSESWRLAADMQTKPKTILLSNTLHLGGAERNVRVLAEGLRPAFDPEIWCFDPGVVQDLAVRQIHRRWKYDPAFVFSLARQLSRSPAQIVHIYHFTIGIYALLANKLIARPKTLIVSFGSARDDHIAKVFYRRMAFRNAFAVTCNSKAVANKLISEGMPEAKLSIIPNGHDLSKYDDMPSREVGRRLLGLAENDQVLVTTGRLVASKRHVDLLKCVDLLARSHPKIVALVVGAGPLDGELRKLAADLGIAPRIRFAGSQSDVRPFLAAADIFVFPSESEGLPNSVIEAALSGLPIVGCSVDGVMDVVEHNVSAVLVEPRNPDRLAVAISGLLENPNTAGLLSERAKATATSKFGREQMLCRFKGLYEQALNES